MPDTPGVQPPVQKTGSAGLELGILSIVLFFVPVVGLLLGIISVSLATKARRLSRASGEQNPKAKSALITGAIGTALSGLFTIGTILAMLLIVTFLSPLTGSSTPEKGGYSEKVQIITNQKKSFTTDETVAFGPLDISVQSVNKSYAPTESEVDYLNTREKQAGQQGTAKYYGWDIPDGDAQYVQVNASVAYNEARGEQLGGVAYSVYSWYDEIVRAELADNTSVLAYVGGEIGSTSKLDDTLTDQLIAGEPIEVTYIFRIPTDEQSVNLTYNMSIFTSVSSFVGTEGMPRKSFEYKLSLW